MADEQLQNLVDEYSELAKDKKIDVASLMLNALQQQDQNRLSLRTKRWVYLVSIGLPPLGYLIAFYLYFKEESDAKQTSYICVGLTTFSFIMTIIFFQAFLKTSGTNVDQLKQIKPTDVYQLTQ